MCELFEITNRIFVLLLNFANKITNVYNDLFQFLKRKEKKPGIYSLIHMELKCVTNCQKSSLIHWHSWIQLFGVFFCSVPTSFFSLSLQWREWNMIKALNEKKNKSRRKHRLHQFLIKIVFCWFENEWSLMKLRFNRIFNVQNVFSFNKCVHEMCEHECVYTITGMHSFIYRGSF